MTTARPARRAGVAAAYPWTSTLETSTPDQRRNAGGRHHCYELTIGARHLGDYLWTNHEQSLRATQRRLAEILERRLLSESLRQPPSSKHE